MAFDRGGVPDDNVLSMAAGRRIESIVDVAQGLRRFYDLDYGMELGVVMDRDVLMCRSRGGFVELISKVLREPTSLEVLYYAQVGGPHVKGLS